MSKYRYLFGPVPSRRLGRSLGVDLTPYKTCSYDCVFCQLGRTTRQTVQRRESAPTPDVLHELDDWIEGGGAADAITLSGSGEPTLHSRFGTVLKHVRKQTDIPSVLLSNGSLFGNARVRESAREAHTVKVTLCAWDEPSFRRIHRPHERLSFEEIYEGLVAFRKVFEGRYWLEIFIVPGMNDDAEALHKLSERVKDIRPDAIHLNTAVRPAADPEVRPLSPRELNRMVSLFTPKARVIAEFSTRAAPGMAVTEKEVLAMLSRRPCTLQQISAVFGIHFNETSKYVGKLLRMRKVHIERVESETYFSAAPNGAAP